MSESQGHSAIVALLKRLELSQYIDKFKEKDITRVVALRQLPSDEFKVIVPNDEDREKILASLNSRGQLNQRGGHSEYPNHHHDVYRSSTPPQHGGYNNHEGGGRDRERGRGRGAGRGGPGGSSNGKRGGTSNRPCRLYFSDKGCPYQNKCRYRHDELGTASGFPPSCEPVLEHELTLKECNFHSTEVTVPSQRIKFLLGVHGSRLKTINEKYGVTNDQITVSQMSEGTISFHIHGKTAESVQAAKNEICAAVGLLNEEKKKDRFFYVVNELELHTDTARLLCAYNTANKGTPYEVSENILRSIISTFRFVPHQEVRHFFINTGPGDKDKLDYLSKLVAQMDGVQAIIFCEANRVQEMSKGAFRISRCMNNVSPIFVHPGMPKAERMTALEEFKKGAPNDRGILQRLLVTTGDYAKLARKCEIPYVNFVIHFSQPKSEEFYALQSNVVGRSGTVGASILCVCPTKGGDHFKELQKTIDFTELDSDERFSETAKQLTYDTEESPLTSTDAYPPADWREAAKPAAISENEKQGGCSQPVTEERRAALQLKRVRTKRLSPPAVSQMGRGRAVSHSFTHPAQQTALV
eukprot:gene8677-6100_t